MCRNSIDVNKCFLNIRLTELVIIRDEIIIRDKIIISIRQKSFSKLTHVLKVAMFIIVFLTPIIHNLLLFFLSLLYKVKLHMQPFCQIWINMSKFNQWHTYILGARIHRVLQMKSKSLVTHYKSMNAIRLADISITKGRPLFKHLVVIIQV